MRLGLRRAQSFVACFSSLALREGGWGERRWEGDDYEGKEWVEDRLLGGEASNPSAG